MLCSRCHKEKKTDEIVKLDLEMVCDDCYMIHLMPLPGSDHWRVLQEQHSKPFSNGKGN